MNKWRLLLSCLLLLILNFSRTVIPVQSQDAPPSSTLQSRRQELADRIADRERLLTAGDPVALVQVRNRIAELELQLFDLDAALAESQASLDLARQFAGTSNAPLLVDTLDLAADVHIHHFDNEASLALLNEALTLTQSLGYRRGEARTRVLLGNTYYEKNDRAAALASCNQALPILRELQDQRGEAQMLITQGLTYTLNEQTAEATAAFQGAEAIARSLNDPIQLAGALVQQNFLAIRQGQWQTALARLSEADSLVPDKDAEPYLAGQIATSFGEIYEAYGQIDTAANYFHEGLTRYYDGAHDTKAAADASSKLGRVMARLHQYTEARAKIQWGLELLGDDKNDLSTGLCHEDLGRVWLEAGSYVEARNEFLTAITYYSKQTGDSKQTEERALARANIYLGQTEQLLGNLLPARLAYEKALSHFEKHPDYTNEAALRFGLGRLAFQQKQYKEAKDNLERSIELTQQLRENAWSKDLRSSFVASVYDRYQTYVELLMTTKAKESDQATEIRAFEVSESGRARALMDSLHDLRELRQPSDPTLLAEEKKLQDREQALIDARASLLSQGGSDTEKAKIDQEWTDVHARFEALEARINSNARFNYLFRTNPLSYEEIRKQLTDTQTSLLSYSLGAQKSFAWLVTKDGLQSFELPGKETIESASKKLLDSLTSPAADDAERDRLQASIDEVSRLVLKPVAEKLPSSRLIVVADGILQYVPFQILQSANGEPLISRLEIVETPSASVLALVRNQRANAQPGSKLLVGFGDAVFSPEYTPAGASAPRTNEPAQTRSEQVSKLNRLPQLFNAKRELLAIAELAGSDSAFFEEYNATRDNLLHLDLSQYRILHVVTHGLMNAQHPELSGLVLSLVDANRKPIAGFVSLADIYKLRAPQLVVLSACLTALGKNQDGEGLIGVTRGFMYAGASGVVASLWQVDDRATAELMKRFYAHMLQGGLGPAAALRAAQNEIRSQPKWSSPYYWAGFTFQGDYDLSIHGVPPKPVRSYQRLIAGGPVLFLLLAVVYWWYLRRRASRATS